MTGHAETLGQALDAVILKAVESRLEESLPEPAVQDGLPGGPSHPNPWIRNPQL